MTRRERLEAKLQKRLDWAGKAEQRSGQRFNTARSILDPIPLGQPILVGHHSEKRHRRALDRADSNMRKGVELEKLAAHHAGAAAGIEHQLNRSIFSDDEDAIEQLEERAQALELKRDRMKLFNKLWKKAGSPKADGDGSMAGWVRFRELAEGEGFTSAETLQACKTLAMFPYYNAPFPSYCFSNIGARIRTARERQKEIERRERRAAEAEAAGGLKIIRSANDGMYCNVVFAEKPARSILDDLRAAGFHWGGGHWLGYTAKLPASVLEMEAQAGA